MAFTRRDSPSHRDEVVPSPRELPSPTPEVTLWWCSLPLRAERAPLERVLSAAERDRMQRFGNQTLRSRYAVGRATLRRLLGQRLGLAPEAVPIERGMRGRPRLSTRTDVDFNVTHTADAALIGIATGLRIGVDVERADRAINAAGIARKFMTDRERAAPGMADAETARQRILRVWTCKEAMSKATGDALSAPFARIDVETAPRLRLAAGPAPYLPSDWRLYAIDVPDGYLATLAIWRGSNASQPPGA